MTNVERDIELSKLNLMADIQDAIEAHEKFLSDNNKLVGRVSIGIEDGKIIDIEVILEDKDGF